jgi:nucleoside phosphorylase
LIINPKPELFPWVVAIDVILHAAIAVIIKIKTPDPVLAVLTGVGIALHQPLNIVLYQGKLLL